MEAIQFDDVVTDSDGLQWSQICGDCIKEHEPEDINLANIAKEGSGICGVKGCSNDNDSVVYIDFY